MPKIILLHLKQMVDGIQFGHKLLSVLLCQVLTKLKMPLKLNSVEKVKKELYDLRRPIPKRNRLRVQTFGNFEAYVDGMPIAFKYSKTKELLAYLIDRKGALCTIGELQAVIFEDDSGHESYMKSLRRDLLETLEAVGCGNAIAQQRGKLGIVPDNLDCDYYDWCDGKRMGIVWQGEYMVQYSWSEYTAGVLERMSRK